MTWSRRCGGGLRVRTLRFAAAPVDLPLVAAQATAAMTNGGYGTTAALLAGGVPLLSVPLTLEQTLVARAVERLGAGVVVSAERADAQSALRAVLNGDRRIAAAGFAARNGGSSWATHLHALLAAC